jgi:hypothetical protein
MIPHRLASALRRDGFDVISCEEAGRSDQQIPDDQQLAFATREGRAILTFNIGDYCRLDTEWKSIGRSHGGIILSPETRDFGTLLRRVERHLNTVPPHLQRDTVLWL